MAKYLSREDILAADDLASEPFFVEEWGGDIRLMEMTASGQMKFEDAIGEADKIGVEALALAVALSAVDANGVRLFSEDDVPALIEKSGAVLTRLMMPIKKLNAMGEAGQDDAEKK